MAPKQTRASTKAKEIQATDTPLVHRLKNIKNTKVQEGPWQKLWAEIQEWAFVDKNMTQAVEKIRRNTLFGYANAPLMASFGGTKEAAVKFIISQYHNGKFYFDRPVEISSEVIYKLTGLSNQGDPMLVDIKEEMVKPLTGTPYEKNSKGLMISQIQSWTPQIMAKIIATGLTPIGRGSDLKLDMLEAVDTIAEIGKVYIWAQYVVDMLKTICEKC